MIRLYTWNDGVMANWWRNFIVKCLSKSQSPTNKLDISAYGATYIYEDGPISYIEFNDESHMAQFLLTLG